MAQGKALYELQDIDLKLLQSQKRLQQIEQQLADNAAVQAAQRKVNQAEETLKPLQVQLKDLELQLKSTRSKRQTTEDRLYSGSVSNPKELQDMQQEIASLNKRDNDLEDKMLELMMEIEDATTTLDTATSRLEQVVADNTAENADLVNERQELQQSVSDLRDKRDKKAATIKEDALAIYNAMRPKTGNRPMAKLTSENSCSMCGVQQNMMATKEIKRGDSLVKCNNCNRILVSL